MSRLQPTLYLSFEVTKVLAGMERDGIKIDRQALNLVKDEYTYKFAVYISYTLLWLHDANYESHLEALYTARAQ